MKFRLIFINDSDDRVLMFSKYRIMRRFNRTNDEVINGRHFLDLLEIIIFRRDFTVDVFTQQALSKFTEVSLILCIYSKDHQIC